MARPPLPAWLVAFNQPEPEPEVFLTYCGSPRDAERYALQHTAPVRGRRMGPRRGAD